MPYKNETPGFVPISEWPTLHDLCDGFGEHLLPVSDKLSGRNIELVFENGSVISHKFEDITLEWTVVDGNEASSKGEAEYKAIEVRPNVFFVDFYKKSYKQQISIIHDDVSGQAVVAISGFEYVEGVKRTYTDFLNAVVKGSDAIRPFQETSELIGKHIVYQYTKKDAYEHVYLNQGTFTWHCLVGTEKGLADTEPCKMLKLGDSLYLLFWAEKIMPVESVVVVDLKNLRSTGRSFCWDPKPAKLEYSLFGSHATVLATTSTQLQALLK